MPLLAAKPPPSGHQELGKEGKQLTADGSPASKAKATPSKTPPVDPTSSTPSSISLAEGEQGSSYPITTLKRNYISDVMAARLASCLIGHVLFLKSQIPYPISQYPRMSQAVSADAKALKKQDDFFSSLDVLTSHLSTTFTSLANSLASSPHISNTRQSSVHLAIVLGPNTMSMSAAKARVLLQLDGFQSPQKRLSKHGRPRRSLNGNLKENIRYDSSDDDSSDDDDDDDVGSHDHGHDCNYQVESILEEDVGGNSDDAESVPDSESEEHENDLNESEESESSDEGLFDGGETEADLQAGERMLSRALAIANGEAENTMSADLRVMHSHILLRAPRRFPHPSWTPQQNITRDMDSLLSAFGPPASTSVDSHDSSLQDVTNKAVPTRTKIQKGKHGIKTECVRVRCQNWDEVSASSKANTGKDTEEDLDSENDMLWWSWNGRLEGFELL